MLDPEEEDKLLVVDATRCGEPVAVDGRGEETCGFAFDLAKSLLGAGIPAIEVVAARLPLIGARGISLWLRTTNTPTRMPSGENRRMYICGT